MLLVSPANRHSDLHGPLIELGQSHSLQLDIKFTIGYSDSLLGYG
jgi:hypothetical protein